MDGGWATFLEIATFARNNNAIQMANSILSIPSLRNLKTPLTAVMIPVDEALLRLEEIVGVSIKDLYNNPAYQNIIMNHISTSPPRSSYPMFKGVNNFMYGSTSADIKNLNPIKMVKTGGANLILIDSILLGPNDIDALLASLAASTMTPVPITSPSLLNKPASPTGDFLQPAALSVVSTATRLEMPSALVSAKDKCLLGKNELALLLGKSSPFDPISERSAVATQRLLLDLEKNYPGLVLWKTADNGDCYYDAMAQSLNDVFGIVSPDDPKRVTIKTLRAQMSNFINNDGQYTHPLVYEKIIRVLTRTGSLDEYKLNVQNDFNMAKQEGKYPVWGNTQVDGYVIMALYNVQIREISEGYLDEGLKGPALRDPSNRIYGDVLHEHPCVPERECPVALIGNIPGHYFSIVGARNSALQAKLKQSADSQPAPFH